MLWRKENASAAMHCWHVYQTRLKEKDDTHVGATAKTAYHEHAELLT